MSIGEETEKSMCASRFTEPAAPAFPAELACLPACRTPKQPFLSTRTHTHTHTNKQPAKSSPEEQKNQRRDALAALLELAVGLVEVGHTRAVHDADDAQHIQVVV